jgi:hypothetical protein
MKLDTIKQSEKQFKRREKIDILFETFILAIAFYFDAKDVLINMLRFPTLKFTDAPFCQHCVNLNGIPL